MMKKKNLKKVLGVATAAVLALAMSMTTFAAGSPAGGASVDGAVDASGNAVQVTTSEVKDQTALDQVQNKDSLTDLLKDKLQGAGLADSPEAAEQLAGKLEVASIMDIDIDAPKGTQVTVTVDVPGAAEPGATVVVLHFEDGSWVVVPAEIIDGKVVFTVTSGSPFAFLVAKGGEGTEGTTTTPAAGSEGTTAAKTTAKTTTTTSPKTGESSMVLVLGLVAIAAAGSAYGLSKKKNA